MDFSNPIAVVSDDFLAVDQKIKDQLISDIPLVTEIVDYITKNQGKRIRPLIALLCAKTVGYHGQKHVDVAAIIEILHTATLLHDDVIDVSGLRRGQATVNRLWGNSGGILSGDFLYTRAFQLMISLRNWDILNLISETAKIIAEGEFLQLMHCRNWHASEQDYLRIIEYKTAVLFKSASQSAALIANATVDQQQALADFGLHFGMAFQLVDDVLDYQGNSESMGKNTGDDLLEGKPTLPLLYAMQHGSKDDQQLIKNAVENKDSSAMKAVFDIVQTKGALTHTLNLARQHQAKAMQALTNFPSSPYKDALLQMTDFVTQRDC